MRGAGSLRAERSRVRAAARLAGPRPGERLERREQLEALSAAIGELTDRQREVFVAIALNEVGIDVLAVRLGANRNAIYKNLFDARRSLRARMAAAGHPVARGGRNHMSDHRRSSRSCCARRTGMPAAWQARTSSTPTSSSSWRAPTRRACIRHRNPSAELPRLPSRSRRSARSGPALLRRRARIRGPRRVNSAGPGLLVAGSQRGHHRVDGDGNAAISDVSHPTSLEKSPPRRIGSASGCAQHTNVSPSMQQPLGSVCGCRRG